MTEHRYLSFLRALPLSIPYESLLFPYQTFRLQSEKAALEEDRKDWNRLGVVLLLADGRLLLSATSLACRLIARPSLSIIFRIPI